MYLSNTKPNDIEAAILGNQGANLSIYQQE